MGFRRKGFLNTHKSDKFIEMFFRPPKKLTAKERVSNLMRSEYLSGIDGESKSKKKRKKKGQAEEEQSTAA